MCPVAESCPTLATTWTVAHQAPLSMGFFQARILEWVAISFSRGASQPRDPTHISQVSCIAGGFFTTELPGKPQTKGKRGQSLAFLDTFVTSELEQGNSCLERNLLNKQSGAQEGQTQEEYMVNKTGPSILH